MDCAGKPAHLLPDAQNLQITGGAFTNVQGNVHYHAVGSGGSSFEAAIRDALRAVPNFREIYQDMLSKATKGTGMWLLKNKKFRIWLEANGNIKIFWGSGMPGAGKTVLASLVIDYLEDLREKSPDQVCVCYFYFRYSDNVRLTLKGVLETLLKQTLERHPDHLALVEKVYTQNLREGTQPSEGQLQGLLRQLASCMKNTFYILDALDEAPPAVRAAILPTLSSLNVKIFMTSRLESVEGVVPLLAVTHRVEVSAQDEDIDRHIAKGIKESFYLIYLLEQEGEPLRQEILSSIKRRSSGMFLYASLQVDALQGCVNVLQVRMVLDDFPSDIKGIYLQTWQRIIGEHPESVRLACMAFLWVLNAARSMTLGELVRAVAISPDTFKLESHRTVPGATLIALCRGLLVVEGESQIVRLTHYTAKQQIASLLHASLPHPQSHLAVVCMTHLKECGLQNSTITSKKDFLVALKEDPLMAYACDTWAFHVRQSLNDESVKQSAMAFIGDIKAFPAFTPLDHAHEFDVLTPFISSHSIIFLLSFSPIWAT